jgi:DNA-binding transcriptional MerR regulator
MVGCGTIDLMQKPFFTSKEAAQMSGCTLRQLQYWREKGTVVPTIDSTGTGLSIYYSPAEVVELTVMEYCLRSGLNFEIAAGVLKLLKDRSPDLIETVSQPWLFSWNDREGKLEMADFSQSKANEWLGERRVVIPLWLGNLNFV